MSGFAEIGDLNWDALRDELGETGFTTTDRLLDDHQCQALIDGYDTGNYRSHILMARYNFGRGEYKYFSYPLPSLVQKLRQGLYQKLVPAAELWAERLDMGARTYPPRHAEYLTMCHDLNQKRPTPLILKYGPEDYNCLHQDLYGELYFPFQVVFMLSDPGVDFSGGEFIITETRPRMQSKANVIALQKGAAAIFAVNYCPRKSVRGYSRTTLRHGVSKVTEGSRHALGIILHDAK